MVSSCKEPSMKRVDALIKRLDKVEKQQQKTDAAFNKLIEDYEELDNLLRNNDNPTIEMQLFRAYLQQYEDERTVIIDEINFTNTQLDNLKYDFQDGRYDESLRKEYLDSEEKSVKQLEAKLNYFTDKFAEQKEFVEKQIKDNI